ncbi:DNA adenine methylase [Cohnella soli]|uniref:site-specific DNA-methyltransferase (adenine-specific) n=1 Tax=Cohnella soli TaxID=425005 RepID=A0ABW0HMJ2_9BACL
MWICQYCEEAYDPEDTGVDRSEEGFWCDYCDGFTYYSGVQQHRFTLILENGTDGKKQLAPAVPIKFKKQMSVLRWPGGKSKFIPYIYSKLQENKTKRLVSPYTGGGSAELALLQAGVVDQLVLNDLDVGIYALYWVMKNMPDDLIERIRSCRPSRQLYFNARRIIKSDYAGCSLPDAAWYTLIVNRLAYSGIYKANPLGGKKGSREDLMSRWNPDKLCQRVEQIHALSDRYEIYNQDALELIESEYWQQGTSIFIDPPFVAKGKQLYRCYYDEGDHYDLQMLLDSLHQGMPGADIILTYDADPLIERIYRYPTEIEKISRVYSV